MPKYVYKAITEDGRVVERTGEYPSLENLIESLRAENLTLISAKEIKDEKKGAELKLEISLPFKGVSDRDWSLLSRQLSVLVGAGVGIVESLELLADQITNKKLKEALLEVAKDIEEGSSFSAALKKRSNIFPELFINLVEVGEETGELDTVLRRASEYYEKLAFIKGKIKSASFYPTFVFVIATIIVWGILTFVVPKFAEIYSTLGGQLPLPTQILINISNKLRENLLNIIGSVFLTAGIFLYFYRTNRTFKEKVHTFLLRIPVLGQIFEKGSLARFSRTLATLFSAGVPIERALEIGARVAGMIPIEKAVLQAKDDVLQGRNLWLALQKAEKFPKMVIAMVKVGEETGRLDEMLNSIANFYEEEVDRLIEGLISLIEPMLIVFLGVVVGGILIALYLPIFKLGELIVR